jgi:hypothetical protein
VPKKTINSQTIVSGIHQELTVRQGDVSPALVPTCSQLWDGGIGVFSISLSAPEFLIADFVTLSLVKLHCEASGEVTGEASGGTVTRNLAHPFVPENGGLLKAPDRCDVYAIGAFAKTAVWMERNVPLKVGRERIRICFAEFPPADNGDPMPVASSVDAIPTPASFGHFCKYQLDNDWEKNHGAIYEVHFDDARGIVALATGSGTVVLLEFL